MASDIPRWAMDEVETMDLNISVASATSPAQRAERMRKSIIARALIEAEAKGAERMKERAAAECDAVANDDGDRAARGFLTTEEQARRGAGRALAASIRNLETTE